MRYTSSEGWQCACKGRGIMNQMMTKNMALILTLVAGTVVAKEVSFQRAVQEMFEIGVQ